MIMRLERQKNEQLLYQTCKKYTNSLCSSNIYSIKMHLSNYRSQIIMKYNFCLRDYIITVNAARIAFKKEHQIVYLESI